MLYHFEILTLSATLKCKKLLIKNSVRLFCNTLYFWEKNTNVYKFSRIPKLQRGMSGARRASLMSTTSTATRRSRMKRGKSFAGGASHPHLTKNPQTAKNNSSRRSSTNASHKNSGSNNSDNGEEKILKELLIELVATSIYS